MFSKMAAMIEVPFLGWQAAFVKSWKCNLECQSIF